MASRGRLTEAWQDRETGRHRRFPALAPALRPWTIALVAVVALVVTGWGTTTTAANSVPGDELYPVKTVQERFVLAVALWLLDGLLADLLRGPLRWSWSRFRPRPVING